MVKFENFEISLILGKTEYEETENKYIFNPVVIPL